VIAHRNRWPFIRALPVMADNLLVQV
jgi:hypothetical protein